MDSRNLFYDLPEEHQQMIYEFDPTYRKGMKQCLKELTFKVGMKECLKELNIYKNGYEWVEGEMRKINEYSEEIDQPIERKHIKFVSFVFYVQDQSASFIFRNQSSSQPLTESRLSFLIYLYIEELNNDECANVLEPQLINELNELTYYASK